MPTCTDCDRAFANDHGLDVHRSRMHKTGPARDTTPPPGAGADDPIVVTIEIDLSWTATIRRAATIAGVTVDELAAQWIATQLTRIDEILEA